MSTLAVIASLALASASGDNPPNSLSHLDRARGWTLLFDGQTTNGWRAYRQQAFPSQGWIVKDGALIHTAGGGGGDIITNDQFGDFELELEFKTAPKANSGIIFRVAEVHDYPWMTGPEFQVLDDGGNNLAPTDPHSAGALYDLYSPADGKLLHPAGEWNLARIRLHDGLLQHFLNDTKVVEVRIDGPEWRERIAASKFRDMQGFGLQEKGHLCLQDHGDEVAYRSIRVRDLDAPMPGEISLFNGKDLTGWKPFIPDFGAPASVWSVNDGVLVCSGNPAGYIRTEKDFTNFILKLEWRWPEGKNPGNSGVLLRMQGPDKVWPRSVEAQLQSGSAGDFWNIDDFQMTTDPARTNGRNTKKTAAAERPVGEWNEYEIIVNDGDVILRVNGQEVNRATNVAVLPGKICLQSEGAEIHFRNIRIVPLP